MTAHRDAPNGQRHRTAGNTGGDMSGGRDSELRVALAQMDIELGRWDVNVRRVARLFTQAEAARANLLVLPELWSTGYDLEECRAHARLSVEEVLPVLAAMAREHRMSVAGSLLVEDERGRVVNRALVLDETGATRACYDKVHLFGPMGEDEHLAPGNAMSVFQLSGIDTGLAICYDLRFPELFRRYALDGAVLMLLMAEWPVARVSHWRTLVRARAIENQCFVAACNRVGTARGTAFAGYSALVDPWGTVIAEGGEEETLVVGTLDIRAIQAARGKIHTLEDRRPDVYDSPPSMVQTP